MQAYSYIFIAVILLFQPIYEVKVINHYESQ